MNLLIGGIEPASLCGFASEEAGQEAPDAALVRLQVLIGGQIVERPAWRASSIVAAVSLFLCTALCAEPVDPSQARKAADAFLKMRAARSGVTRGTVSIASETGVTAAGLTAAGIRDIRDEDGTVLAYVTDLKPRGFIATSADTDIAPVIAYSFRSSFPTDHDKINPLYRMLCEDMRLRAQALAENPESASVEAGGLWNSYVGVQAGEPNQGVFQQWPAEGTSSTGGWLNTAWDQAAPYNQFCPLDPVGRGRSYVGCAATAVAQLANYHQRCTANFTDADAYTAYSGLNMDADSALYDFPTFIELNAYLDAVRIKYSQGSDLNDVDAAALSFACGVATVMDYSSEGSGASPSDVRDALLGKLGFHSADMLGGLSADTSVLLQENLVNGLPALMGICTADGMMGHLLVCDGYNTDNEYHLNFGWGSDRPVKMTEVWYRLPTGLLSRKNVVTEILLNIQPGKPDLEADPASMGFYSAPGGESAVQSLHLANNVVGVRVISVSSPDGFLIARAGKAFSDHLDAFTLQRVGLGQTVDVKFHPERAGGYYGTLAVQYGDGKVTYVILKGWSYAGGTQIGAGDVSGTWSQAQSPYFVTGHLQVLENTTLTVEPGVKVFFLGPFSMTVGKNATLMARGTAASPIEFTAWNKDSGWTGLRFVDSGSDDVLSYCSITLARKGAGLIPPNAYSAGSPQDLKGGAIFCSSSDPTIENCRIANNVGDVGGAIYCIESSPVISNTLIANNASLGGRPRAGGLCCDDWGVPELRNCTIVRNSPGGIYTTSWEGTTLTNTIVWDNDIYQIQTEECSPTVSFCNVQGGYRGDGNMDVDPCFFDPSDGVGIDYDGSAANWALQTRSPCINSGTWIDDLPAADLAGASRVHSDVIDMGAYENQSDAPLMTVSPSAMADAGCVGVDVNSVVPLDIANTGTGDFEIDQLSIIDANGVFSLVTPIQDRVLPPGDSVQVKIAFRPREEKSYTGVVDIRSTAENSGHRQVTLRGVGVSGTIVSGPSVSGTWRKSQSPYIVTGDIRIPRSRTLTIEPGVVVTFAGRFSLTVGYRATLRASGTEQDKIVFTASDTEKGWSGIRLLNSGADDTLSHCTIQYAKKPSSSGGGLLDLLGGAILCSSPEDEEPGFPIPSSPTIDYCLITHNHARRGGAIMCTDESEAIITNNTIVDNSAEIDGGAFALYYAYCVMANNVIAANSAGAVGGAIMNYLGCPLITNNTMVHNRPSAMHLEVTTVFGLAFETCVIVNNIIWDNEVFLSEEVVDGEYEIQYNDIQGGWAGTGNIDVDPLFADPGAGDYHLKSRAGRWDPVAGNWVNDDVTSPCIDAGDPDLDVGDEPETNGQRVNMGAYGGTDQASKSPGQ